MTKTYKWTLRKGGKKDICPQCGKKRFVPFVLTADPSVKAGAEFGRCDREQSCGYFRYPDGVQAESVREHKPEPKKDPMLYGGYLAEGAIVTRNNTLFDAYWELFGKPVDLWSVMDTMYHCGTGANGECIYYQFDGDFVRTAKAIRYGKDGHRLKGESGDALPVWWLHKAKGFEIPEDKELKQCFFGQHLLRDAEDKQICIVEAEKTAVLMAAVHRYERRTDCIWIACGGSQMLKGAIDLMPLIGRKVVLFPDHGQYWNWYRTAQAYGWRCVDIAPFQETYNLPDGYDIWDIYERNMQIANMPEYNRDSQRGCYDWHTDDWLKYR